MSTRYVFPRRAKYRAARAFYLTLLIGTVFATYSLLSHPFFDTPQPSLHSRSLEPPLHARDEGDECRRVHKASDQCAYVRAHCPKDEGGFTAYLDLYYCRMPDTKPLAFIILISWLGLLFSTIGIAASDFFCIDLSTIAAVLGMSESVAGVTFLAFGNGSPDVFSTFAAMSTNSGSLAVGELFGAAGFITAVVSGSMALIRPFQVPKKSFIRDVGFFTVAAAFSMVFLWDGKLRFWECASMVAYYIFYVVFVVTWHWWLNRKRTKREKEAAARGHFLAPGDEHEFEDEYQDDPEEDSNPRRMGVSRGVSREDWSALEAGSAEYREDYDDEDDEEEARDKWMGELASNMRLTRATARSRRNTVTPVRPSLVGALEFQAVLKSLQKSRNLQTIPMDSRRYSDDPTYTTLQQQDHMSSTSDPAARPPYEVHITEESSPLLERPDVDISTPLTAPAGRTRAVSANDAASLRVDSSFQNKLTPIQSEENLIDVTGDDDHGSRSSTLLDVPSSTRASHPHSPNLRVEPASSQSDGRELRSPASTTSGGLLAPSDALTFNRQSSGYFDPIAHKPQGTGSQKDTPSAVPRARELPKIIIPDRHRSRSSSRATSPFPAYRDHPSPSVTASSRSARSSRAPSIALPGPLASPESLPADQAAEQEMPRRPTRLTRLWPHRVLPPPGVLISTLFPTIYHWPEKNIWEKALGIIAAPSVFLLTITLPVVENEQDNKPETASTPSAKNTSLDTGRSKSAATIPTTSSAGPSKGLIPEYLLDPSSPRPDHHHHSIATEGVTGMGTTASVAASAEQHRHNYGANAKSHASISVEPQAMNGLPADHAEQSQSETWNRWLTITQLFLAPIFIVLAIYVQAPSDIPSTWLVRPILVCLLVSLVLLIPLLLTTTPTHRPSPYRIILSLAGFVVSIAWISAIADQVVGALKALAVILNMSHAIMGLTIFAVGNSLGDFVADVTVAKLGYPVMALSACFGGPMLNILLGVGLSGSYILIRGAEKRHDRHPEKGIRFKSFHIEVSKTLIVSGVTLLVTLLGLLVVIPMNKWVFTRKIGWALIALWTVSTVFNVVIEVTGWLGEIER